MFDRGDSKGYCLLYQTFKAAVSPIKHSRLLSPLSNIQGYVSRLSLGWPTSVFLALAIFWLLLRYFIHHDKSSIFTPDFKTERFNCCNMLSTPTMFRCHNDIVEKELDRLSNFKLRPHFMHLITAFTTPLHEYSA
jgi:hypothetical protein